MSNVDEKVAKGFGDDRPVKTVRRWQGPDGIHQLGELDLSAPAPLASHPGDNHKRLIVKNISMQMFLYGR